jgi:pimeloyl-ACP methyl ester carboxylesterase
VDELAFSPVGRIFVRRLARVANCFRGLAVCLLLALPAGPAFAQDKQCAVVLMHGKWGNTRYISFFGNRLEPVCAYRSIEMPWSGARNYDEPYPVAIAQIKTEVARFRQQGFKRVFVAGHSFGANAALAYMAVEGDVDGIIALAPGHAPFYMYDKGISKGAVDKARRLVADGKGDETVEMDDLNQGVKKAVSMKANVLLSYFDPEGLGHMQLTAGKFRKPVPFLYVVGTRDPFYPYGPDLIFNKAPQHSSSRYLVVEADHRGTPDASADLVLEWIKGLL